MTGFEPATPGTTIRCSNLLSYIHHASRTESSRLRGRRPREATTGRTLLPGALRLLEALRAGGVPYVFATNNSSKTGDQYLRHLGASGSRSSGPRS
jgi:phosphoglycolate phosphatase-like HAD superfamily hydrolase